MQKMNGTIGKNMPVYTLRDESNPQLEQWDEVMTWDELKSLLENNPNLKQVLKPLGFITGRKDVMAMQSDGFKDLKGRMHKAAGRQSKIRV